ncbi:hypothetical protein COCCADRAFT_107162 [Bipolaris zeicola 26-R-13]|uniref:C2H2-type domain-containing protein n=1 Tax=Cochliobolus carbonum (strain 26-R-13) TaxID=930089 RepID=W6Y2E3_COCC2|nr:uncharacterized protein COCCADRAFT_107162 [Bipolaris zeicola 26-R-13]EUC29199.1 hypothetical protein COCCADRAFT_107162 [Bipolaris zeicola 26-R-13]
MAVVQQQQRCSKQTSIILTLRILLFVKQLRRRVEPRVHNGSSVDSGRLGVRLFRSSGESHTPASAAPASRNLAGDKVQQMLSTLDGKVGASTGNAFSATASNSALFLKHSNAAIVEGRSMNETIQLLAAVHGAINVLADCRGQYGDEWLLAQGLEAGLVLDDSFIANYEHLLLRLQTDLVAALSRKVLEELLRGGHDKKQRKMLGWFSEFAEKPQALSTSFPWTIKPSLAVLWGVCWMFYECAGQGQGQGQGQGGEQMGNERARVSLECLLQNISLPWDSGASSDYVSLGRALIGSQAQQGASLHAQAANARVDLGHGVFQARNTETWESDFGTTGRLPALVESQAGSRAAPEAVATPEDTYYAHAAPYYQPVQPVNLYSPHSPGSAAPLTAYPHLGNLHNPTHPTPSWHHSALPPQLPPRHLINTAHNPTIRVITVPDDDLFAPPQTGFASPSIYRQPEAPLNLNSSPYYHYSPSHFNMTDLAPTTAPTLPAPHEHKRTSSVNSLLGDMPTPVSLSCPRSPIMTSPTAGERRQSLAASPPRSHSRSLSVDSSQDGDDDGSLRKNHSYKRAEEPPRNEDGKMVCKYQECQGVSFDRKCEWSKHMDKHDRPYKCNAKGCEKLQGFTYSGGLLRHEREVHKMHGGTKKSLFCPFPDCKRSSGAGFTRKENLAEHIRRVHRRTSMSADLHGLVIRRDMVRREIEGSPIRESHAPESPYIRPMEYREEEDISMKRKRGASDSEVSERDNDEMRSEIKRLRQENEEKDSRLKQLEQAVMALQQQGRR